MSLMSLKRFLEVPVVSRQFAALFPKPGFMLKKEILAAPRTKNYSLVGTAFDYLLRFLLERVYPGAVTTRWVAEKVIRESGTRTVMLYDAALWDETVRDLLSKARMNHSQFLKTGVIGDDLIRGALHLAQLDPVARGVSSIEEVHLGLTSKDDVDDLRRLLERVDMDTLQAKEICVLNPVFGKASQMVGVAGDADILLDDILLEVKTIQKLALRRDHFHQLIGYYLLACIGGVDGLETKPGIMRLGIYFSRHAELFTFPVSEVIKKRDLQRTLEWFEALIERQYPQKSPIA